MLLQAALKGDLHIMIDASAQQLASPLENL